VLNDSVMKILPLLALHLFFSSTVAQNVRSENDNKKNKLTYANEVETRIKRVENGLLVPVIIKGALPVRLKLQDRMRHYNTAGITIAVINNGKLEWARGYGVKEFGANEKVTSETLFAAGSISKPVAAMAALNLVDKGKLALDEDVNEKLTSWKVPENEFTKESKVTLRRILNHTSGLPLGGGSGKTYRYGEPFPTIVQALNGLPPADNQPVEVQFVPNCRWSYSSAGYAVAQLLMTDVTRKSFPELMKEIVFDALGMNTSTFENPVPPAIWGKAATGHRSVSGIPIENKYPSTINMAGGGLWSTPTDLARFVLELQNAKTGKSKNILAPETANLMLNPFRAGWSLGLEINTEGRTPFFSHSGGMPGFTSLMIAYNWEGKGAIVMVNQDTYNGMQILNEVMLGIAREYNWKDYNPIERSVVKVDPATFNRYKGFYEIDQGYPITIITKNDRLYLIWALGNVYEMFPVGENKFFIVREGAPTYEFIRNDQGEVTAVKREWYGGISNGKKANIPEANLKGTTTLQLKGFPDALIVSVAGSFNNWNPRETICTRDGNIWLCRLDLKPGRYSYKFVVDNKFIVDPSNRQIETDSTGDNNSFFIVK
jgi:CubicO group peptidase (beta-lactamase class C family)